METYYNTTTFNPYLFRMNVFKYISVYRNKFPKLWTKVWKLTNHDGLKSPLVKLSWFIDWFSLRNPLYSSYFLIICLTIGSFLIPHTSPENPPKIWEHGFSLKDPFKCQSESAVLVIAYGLQSKYQYAIIWVEAIAVIKIRQTYS